MAALRSRVCGCSEDRLDRDVRLPTWVVVAASLPPSRAASTVYTARSTALESGHSKADKHSRGPGQGATIDARKPRGRRRHPDPHNYASHSLRRGAFAGYRWLLLIFLLRGTVQIFLPGFGVFSLHGQEVGAPGETAFDPHRSLGFAMGGLALIILVLALVARRSVRSMVLTAVMFLLAFLAQSFLANLGGSNAFFGGLHAFDGLAILGIAGYLYGWSRRHGS